uniref:Ubiquitin carboxyl-terminal hydrolase 51-like n=1 Tax=Camelus bactrianus TaxID=9837 RepID=A0A9W3H217_CAMBA|nr:ubiquitin carboxyl-terminal hydrolase 51-like [Camelus bactrianus]
MAQIREASLPSGSLVHRSSGGGGGASPEEVAEKAGEMEEEAVGATKAYSGLGAEEMKLEPLQEPKPAHEENLTWSSGGGGGGSGGEK